MWQYKEPTTEIGYLPVKKMALDVTSVQRDGSFGPILGGSRPTQGPVICLRNFPHQLVRELLDSIATIVSHGSTATQTIVLETASFEDYLQCPYLPRMLYPRKQKIPLQSASR